MTKLFKLLYFLDFEHYKQTGRSVTGLEYYAWKMGPVPVALREEIDYPEPDLAQKVAFESVRTKYQNNMLRITPQAEFDPIHFTKRELHLLERLACEFAMSNADEMVEATHLETLPWHRVYCDEGKRQSLIPYEYALKPEETEAILNIAAENEEVIHNYNDSGNSHH
jgi:uncharacterized phage-associated protein